MIELRSLKDSDRGRLVIYTPWKGEPESGELTSWNDTFVFVRFKGPSGEACSPLQCEFALALPGSDNCEACSEEAACGIDPKAGKRVCRGCGLALESLGEYIEWDRSPSGRPAQPVGGAL